MTEKANNLDGTTWTKYSLSIWSDIRKSKDEVELKHPAIFPRQLVSRLINCFTRNSKLRILDPFCGSGSTIVVASEMGHTGIGFEVSSKYIELTKERLAIKTIWQANEEVSGSAQIYHDDARNILKYIPENTIDIVITSPPYWNILSEKRTADLKNIRNYENAENDLSKLDKYEDFLNELLHVFKQVFVVMKPKAYCIIIVMDLRKKSKFYPFHADIAEMMGKIGFIYDDLIIWDRRKEYNNLRPLGYPTVFRINKVHEYILIFQKPV